MKKSLLIAGVLLMSLFGYAQANYKVSYQTNVGNPGGLNTTADADLAGWNTLVFPAVATNSWSGDSLLPFPFNFYGNPVTSLRASSNGLITFSRQTTLPGENTDLPSNILPDSTIACFWDAFTNTPPTGNNDYVVWRVFGTAPNRQLWIKWVSYEIGAPALTSSAGVNFGCVLEETTNNIYLVEMDFSIILSTPATSVTAGLQLNNTTAVQYDTKYLQRPNNGSAASDNNYVMFSSYATSNMTVQGIEVSQPNLNNVSRNSNDNEILRVKVSVNGELSPLTLSQLEFTTNGTSNLGDISEARVFYTGKDSVFNTRNQFGSDITNIMFAINASGSQQLAMGDNYFWLTYSTSNFSSPFNVLDGEFLQATINANIATSTGGTPSGNRPISYGLSGSIPVGTGGTYTLLSEAFKAINTEGLDGDVTLSIISDIEDTGSAYLSYRNTAGHRIIVEPSSNIIRNIGSRVLNAYIDIDGASHVVFNGNDPVSGTGKYLKFINRSDSGATFRFRNGARLDTIKNCIVEGAVRLQSMGVIHIAGSATTQPNRDIVISHNDIRDRSDSISIPAILIYSKGTYTARNGFITVENNNLFNYMRSGVFVDYTGNTGNWKVIGNSFYYNSATPQPSAGDLVSLMLSPGLLAENNQVHNNYFGGTAPACGGTPWVNATGMNFVVMNINSGINVGTSVQGNTIQNINLTSPASTAFVGIRLESGRSEVGNLVGNIIGHPTIAGSVTCNLYLTFGIYSYLQGNGEVLIGNNIVANINGTSNNGGASVRGICIQGGAVSPDIYNNQVYNLTAASAATFTTTTALSGICIVSGTNLGQIKIRGNKIYNLSSTAASANVYPSGIIIDHLSANGLIENNTVYNITGVSSGTSAAIHGLYIVGPVTNWLVRNNMISLSNVANTGGIIIRGISDNASGNNVRYYHNSVYIGGEAVTGTANSFAFERRNANSIPELRNNIFYNERKGGTGIHAAIANVAAATNWTANTSGYNLLVSASPANIGAWGATNPVAQSFRQWQTASGGDYTSWSDTAAVVLADSLFVDKSIGNLSIDSTKSQCWYVAGKGIALAGTHPDKDNQPRSASVIEGAANIGADEFDRYTLPVPPLANVTGNIAIGDSSVYTFAGRNIATLYWNSGFIPTGVDCRFYTGVYPVTPLPSGAIFNNYIEMTPVGGSGYTFDIKQYYDSAQFGTVTNTSNITTAFTQAAVWNSNATVLNTSERSFRSNNFSELQLSSFSGTDVTNPIPVKLTSFTGINRSGNALLNWVTASEKNVDRFEVIVSTNGKQFKHAGTVYATGNTSSITRYAFTDNNAFQYNNSSTLYYRLRIIDKDGSVAVSETLILTDEHSGAKAEVFPNPYSPATRIHVVSDSETSAHVIITSIHGNVIADQVTNVVTGSNLIIPAELENAPQGIYFVSVEVDGIKQSFKLVK